MAEVGKVSSEIRRRSIKLRMGGMLLLQWPIVAEYCENDEEEGYGSKTLRDETQFIFVLEVQIFTSVFSVIRLRQSVDVPGVDLVRIIVEYSFSSHLLDRNHIGSENAMP